MWIAPAIEGGASLLGELFGGDDASDEASQAAAEAAAERRREFGEAKEFLSPYQQAGLGALPGLQAFAGEDPAAIINRILSQYQVSPAQQFVQRQATEAVQNQAESAGLLQSGAERTALAKTIAGLASQNQQQFLQNVLGERTRRLQTLQNLFGTGAQSAQALASGAIGTGAGIARDIETGGAARAAGDLQLQNLLSGLGGMVGGVFEQRQQQDFLRRLLGQ